MSVTKPTHPGAILWHDFLMPHNISCYQLAKDIKVPVNRITAIVDAERGITAETGLLLSRYFDLSDIFWTHLQARYELECAKETLKEKLDTISPYKFQ